MYKRQQEDGEAAGRRRRLPELQQEGDEPGNPGESQDEEVLPLEKAGCRLPGKSEQERHPDAHRLAQSVRVWMALMLSLMLTTFVLEGVQNLGAAMPVVSVLYAVPTVIFIVLPFIFPNGRFVPRWIVWLAIPILGLTLVATFLPQQSVLCERDR